MVSLWPVAGMPCPDSPVGSGPPLVPSADPGPFSQGALVPTFLVEYGSMISFLSAFDESIGYSYAWQVAGLRTYSST